ncbi:hypothetical protein BSKO_03301 [Bryopsis sp. KO-2023]|nr:hypothetical protein BSKO_03301 [Bryopsis sp. KO-2023]
MAPPNTELQKRCKSLPLSTMGDWCETLEEVAALRSIWGNEAFVTSSPGLTTLLDKVGEGAWDPSTDHVMTDTLRFTIQVGGENDSGTLSVSVGLSYPEAPPQLSVACEWLKRSQIDDILLEVQTFVDASSKLADRCLFSAVERFENLIEENYTEFSKQSKENLALASKGKPNPHPGLNVAVLRIDHMHDRGGYTKIIVKWAGELGLTGRLIFCRSFIFVLLEGAEPDIDEYLLRKRTVVVDVDSRGRKCRERKMSVLVRRPCSSRAFSEFEVVESDEVGYVDSLFEKVGLGALVKNIMHLV